MPWNDNTMPWYHKWQYKYKYQQKYRDAALQTCPDTTPDIHLTLKRCTWSKPSTNLQMKHSTPFMSMPLVITLSTQSPTMGSKVGVNNMQPPPLSLSSACHWQRPPCNWQPLRFKVLTVGTGVYWGCLSVSCLLSCLLFSCLCTAFLLSSCVALCFGIYVLYV